MVNGAVDSGLGARDFCLKGCDPRFQFIVGKRIEVLPGEHHQRIAGIFGQDVVEVHKSGSLTKPMSLSMKRATSAFTVMPDLFRHPPGDRRLASEWTSEQVRADA